MKFRVMRKPLVNSLSDFSTVATSLALRHFLGDVLALLLAAWATPGFAGGFFIAILPMISTNCGGGAASNRKKCEPNTSKYFFASTVEAHATTNGAPHRSSTFTCKFNSCKLETHASSCKSPAART